MDWSSARCYCKKHYIDLAVLTEATEKLVEKELSPHNYSFWIGIQYQQNVSTYVWVNGTPVNAYYLTSQNISSNPNQQDCIVMQNTLWYAEYCQTKMAFMCNADPLSSTTLNITVVTNIVDDSPCTESSYSLSDTRSISLTGPKTTSTPRSTNVITSTTTTQKSTSTQTGPLTTTTQTTAGTSSTTLTGPKSTSTARSTSMIISTTATTTTQMSPSTQSRTSTTTSQTTGVPEASSPLTAVAVRQALTWKEARLYCRTQHSDLLSVTGPDSQRALEAAVRELQGPGVWLGLRKHSLWGHWYWAESQEPLNYSCWDQGQPDGQIGELCGMASLDRGHNYRWSDECCEKLLNFVCH
ncbi:MRC1 protein, partial [Amia calva]|nr:MRC1 protein [Amia calva]